jgi:Na+-transporting NADH:ubiquinone oxidoreductase subunit NqrB
MNKEKHMLVISVICLFISCFVLMYCFGVSKSIETDTNDLIDYSICNEKWMKFRDLFTPMYNDSVTIESAGYNNGWLFWVNHSRVLNSFYFDNQQSYLVVITVDGYIEMIN